MRSNHEHRYPTTNSQGFPELQCLDCGYWRDWDSGYERTWDDEEAKCYNADGTLTPFGLASWLDEEGGVFSFIQGRGISELVEVGVNEEIASKCESAMEALKEELRRIGAVI